MNYAVGAKKIDMLLAGKLYVTHNELGKVVYKALIQLLT
jgi:hypothetical protein